MTADTAASARVGAPFSGAVTFLAPMEGITRPFFRHLIAGHGGLDYVCTEFVRVTAAPLGRKVLQEAVVPSVGAHLSVQVMGNDPERLAEAARAVAAAGADVVDINLGCPTRKALRKGVGAAMLRDPELLSAVARSLREAVPGVFSAKMRAGFDRADVALSNARRLVDAGVDFIAIHPRRRVDGYRGVADFRIVQALARQLPVPVIGNGDLWYAADALRLEAESGAAGVMMGRPAMRNPWIFRQVDELRRGVEPFAPSGADVVGHVRTLWTSLAAAGLPERRLIGPLKEHLSWLLRAVPERFLDRKSVLRLPEGPAILDLVEARVGPLQPSDLDLAACSRLRLENVPSLTG